MNSIMLLVAVLFLFALILAFIKALSQREPSIWPFYPRKPLSPPEQILYFRLIKALPEHIVLAQVQLSRFLAVKKGNNFQSWLNRINRMSADFVICNKDASVLAVIELDDATHNSKTRQQADNKKDKAISSAGLRIIRWNVKSLPDEQTIRNSLVPTA
jgi:very-short-patch-repair endonuclease